MTEALQKAPEYQSPSSFDGLRMRGTASASDLTLSLSKGEVASLGAGR